MEPMRGVSPSGIPVRRIPREQQGRGQRNGSDFESEFENQRGGEPHAEKPDAPTSKRLQVEPEQVRRTPSDGEFHIDVLA